VETAFAGVQDAVGELEDDPAASARSKAEAQEEEREEEKAPMRSPRTEKKGKSVRRKSHEEGEAREAGGEGGASLGDDVGEPVLSLSPGGRGAGGGGGSRPGGKGATRARKSVAEQLESVYKSRDTSYVDGAGADDGSCDPQLCQWCGVRDPAFADEKQLVRCRLVIDSWECCRLRRED